MTCWKDYIYIYIYIYILYINKIRLIEKIYAIPWGTSSILLDTINLNIQWITIYYSNQILYLYPIIGGV
jgi:hypothetical protein